MTRLNVVAYPFLAALYPVLALAAANGGELVSPRDLARPLGLSLVFALAAWLLSRLATRDPHRRGMLTFIAVIAFASYGYWQALLEGIDAPPSLIGDAVALPFVLALLVLVWCGARRGGRSYVGLSRYLNLVMLLLLGVAAVQFAVTRRQIDAEPSLTRLPLRAVGAGAGVVDRPHLFIVVLDKYTGSRSLRANFGFDNGRFEQALEARGFQVARHAHANYVHTFLALASMLNWDYLDGLADSLGADAPRSAAFPLIEDNRTWRALKKLGYRFIFMPTGYAATAGNRHADLQLPDPDELTREFEAVWLRTTMLHPIVRLWCRGQECSGTLVPFVHESAASIDWKFEKLAGLARSAEPLFVFAHLMVPHEPYIYSADCSHVSPFWPRRGWGGEDVRIRTAYVAQLTCVNEKLERLAAELDRGRRPSIVLLQSDHGHGWIGPNQPSLATAPSGIVAERLDAFAAYRLPGAPPDLVNDSIGPVNAMRAIMRYYYGLELPPRPEASFWSERATPYRFVRVR